jgi:glycosyltransferase involved in cell wall biosynthesis
VMVEAMACGTPVLALSGGAVPEVVSDGISGFVCGSVDEMVTRVRCLHGAIKPANVRQYCQQYFSVERMVSDYLALYQELAAEESRVGELATRIPMIA